jgi:hypothetical protein
MVTRRFDGFKARFQLLNVLSHEGGVDFEAFVALSEGVAFGGEDAERLQASGGAFLE